MFSHLDAQNRPSMVNVGDKVVTHRTAHAVAFVTLPAELATLLRDGEIATKKGPIFQTAIVAGVMGAKRTSELIPLCHPLPLSKVEIEINPEHALPGFLVQATVKVTAKTGVEMEALTAVSISCLTIYDMVKAVERGIRIEGIRLLLKSGGKSGEWRAEA
jgi:cyclic pyranopterin phosphate synthase